MIKWNIIETDNFYPLAVLFQESSLEVNPNAAIPEGIIKMWRCESVESGELIGGATVQILNDVYVLKHLAIRNEYRKLGIGKRLLELAENELINRGAKEMWLSGKVPEYYVKYGWERVFPNEAPNFSKCTSCKQFNISCFPSIMKKSVEIG